MQMTDLFSEVAHQMPIQLVEPIERMINRDTRYRLSVQQFMMVRYLTKLFNKLHLCYYS